MKRGDIYYVNLGRNVMGSEQSGVRPCLVIQNDVGNRHSPTTIVACITSKQTKSKIPTHVNVSGFGLPKDSVIMFEQLRTIDKCRVREYIGNIPNEIWEDALKISIGV